MDLVFLGIHLSRFMFRSALNFRIGAVGVELAAGEEEVGGGAAQTGC